MRRHLSGALLLASCMGAMPALAQHDPGVRAGY